MVESVLAEDDDEAWEYEYDQHETETFLVDLDLTTVNRVIKPANATRAGKTLNIPSASNTVKSKPTTPAKKNHPTSKKAQAVETVDDANSGDVRETQHQDEDDTNEGGIQATDHGETGSSIQILDLHTENPVVCYKGAIYSCTWHDMIGTSMFFTKPGELPLIDPELSTKVCDLIGTTRLKLVGNEAKVTPKPRGTKRSRGELDDNANEGSPALDGNMGKSLGTIRSSSSKINADIRKQANFLQQLMKVKKARGDVDNVRFVANKQLSEIDAAGGANAMTDTKRKHIDTLNERVAHGDGEALTELQQIYARLNEEPETEDSPNARDQQSARSVRQSRIVLSDSEPPEEVENG